MSVAILLFPNYFNLTCNEFAITTNVTTPDLDSIGTTLNIAPTNATTLNIGNPGCTTTFSGNTTFVNVITVTGGILTDSIDTITSTPLLIGQTHATAIDVGSSGISLNISCGNTIGVRYYGFQLDTPGFGQALTIAGTNATNLNLGNNGSLSTFHGLVNTTNLDSLPASTTLAIGQTNATAINIGSSTASVSITSIPPVNITTPGGASSTGVNLLSGNTSNPIAYAIGRTAMEARIAIASGSNQFVNGSVAGDLVIESTTGTSNIFLSADGTNATIKLNSSLMTITPLIDAFGGIVTPSLFLSGLLYVSSSTTSITLNGREGYLTFTSQNISALSSVTYTITNSSLLGSGTLFAVLTAQSVASGSFVFITNTTVVSGSTGTITVNNPTAIATGASGSLTFFMMLTS
jgi:hypothetical protein